MGYWDHDYGWGWLGLLVMIVTMLIFWGGLVTVVVIVARRFGHTDRAPRQGNSRDAERILDERFARGEIDEEELTARRTALRGDAAR
jgi:putative membrane protein